MEQATRIRGSEAAFHTLEPHGPAYMSQDGSPNYLRESLIFLEDNGISGVKQPIVVSQKTEKIVDLGTKTTEGHWRA